MSMPYDPSGAAAPPPPRDSRPMMAHAVYALYALTFLTAFTALVGVIIAYMLRQDVAGTWLEGHVRWQIRTFWYGLLFQAVGWATVWFLIGWLVLLAGTIWFIWRIAKGWVRLGGNRPIEEPAAFL